MIFTKLPRELRDQIYGYIFNSSPSDTPSSQIARPLETCRQFYFEARFFAFSHIDWRIDVGDMCKEYYSNDLFNDFGELMTEPTVSNVWETGSPSEFASMPKAPYFTMKSLMTKAGLREELRTSLRCITITNCWYDCHLDRMQTRPPNDILWYLLHDLRDMLGESQRLNCITLERPEPPAWKDLPRNALGPDGLPNWKPGLDLLWAMDVTKRFQLKGLSESDTESQQVRYSGQEFVEICWDRMAVE